MRHNVPSCCFRDQAPARWRAPGARIVPALAVPLWLVAGLTTGLCGVPPTRAGSPATSETVNPHWNEALCQTCHPSRPDGSLDAPRLRERSARATCDRCHTRESLDAAMHHPYDIRPSERVPASPDWPLEMGRLSCLTCHDILRQCDLKMKERWRNRMFLRAQLGAAAIEFCLQCHREELYRTASPHDQLDDQGREREGVCLYCHTVRPDPAASDRTGSPTLQTSIIELCGNCHGTFVHPSGIPHLVVIDEQMRARMAACEILDRFVIPLSELQRYLEGQSREPRSFPLEPPMYRATCVTCHNPHERGVLPPSSPLARGAEGDLPRNSRLRMPRQELCSCCHRI